MVTEHSNLRKKGLSIKRILSFSLRCRLERQKNVYMREKISVMLIWQEEFLG